MNPFQSSSSLNQALSIDTCQEMVFSAALYTPRFRVDPVKDVLGLRDLASVYGREAYILHPAAIEQMFRGVTLAIYQETQLLFCSRVFRSYQTIWRILGKFAEEAGASLIAQEAIWALCGHLSAYRDERLLPLIEHTQDQWYVGQVRPNVLITDNAEIERPDFTCIIDTQHKRMIAFRKQSSDDAQSRSSIVALYDGLCAQRHPMMLAPGGLTWFLPGSLVAQVALPHDVMLCCKELGIAVDRTSVHPPLVDDLQGTWTRSLAGRSISSERFVLILDNYLEKRHQYGPLIVGERAAHTFRHLEGYNRDPALVLPPLRWLLPAYAATIEKDSIVRADGRRYHDDLLRYWIGFPVTVRVSPHNPDFAYIYLDGEILCVASQAV